MRHQPSTTQKIPADIGARRTSIGSASKWHPDLPTSRSRSRARSDAQGLPAGFNKIRSDALWLAKCRLTPSTKIFFQRGKSRLDSGRAPVTRNTALPAPRNASDAEHFSSCSHFCDMASSNGHGSGHGPVRSRRRDLHTALSYRRGRAVAVRQVVRIGRGSAAAVGSAMSLAAARLHPSAPDTRRSPSRLRRVEEGSRKAVRQFPPSSSSADGWLGSPSSPPRNLDLAENRRKFQLFASAAHHVALLLLLWPFAAQRLSPVRTRWATEKHFPILPCFFRLARRAAIFPRRGFFRSANFLLPRPPALRPRAQSNRPHTRACHGPPLLIRTFSPLPPNSKSPAKTRRPPTISSARRAVVSARPPLTIDPASAPPALRASFFVLARPFPSVSRAFESILPSHPTRHASPFSPYITAFPAFRVPFSHPHLALRLPLGLYGLARGAAHFSL